MKAIFGLMFLAFSASTAMASTGKPCADLWFTRNAVMNGAGYCFGSALGQAIFGTAGCTGGSVSLDAQTSGFVGQVQALEARIGCRVDTSVIRLDLPDLAWRRQVQELPLLDELAWGCLGWRGPRVTLHAGRSDTTTPIGQIEPGDFVSFDHQPAGEWSYVTVQVPGWSGLKSAGWMQTGLAASACPESAG